MKRKFTNIIIFTLIFLLAFLVPAGGLNGVVSAETLQQKLDRLNQEIIKIKHDRQDLQTQVDNNAYLIEGYNSQVSKLYAQALVYKKQIDQFNLEIEQLETSIKLLQNEIQEKEDEIKQQEEAINALQDESDQRIENNYYNFRLYGGEVEPSSIFNTDSINSYYKDSQYKELIQADTNDMMVELARLKEQLQNAKQDLDNKVSSLKKDEIALNAKKQQLDKSKNELDVQMAAYVGQISKLKDINENTEAQVGSYSKEMARKAAQAEAVKSQLFGSFKSTSPGEYVSAGRIIGKVGCTGLCSGPHDHHMIWVNGSLRDPCAYLPNGAYGCGYGGGNAIRTLPVSSNATLTSGYGNRCFYWGSRLYCDFHTGIDLALPKGSPIFATINGYAYKGIDPYGAKYVIICEVSGCRTGKKTGDWHMSSF